MAETRGRSSPTRTSRGVLPQARQLARKKSTLASGELFLAEEARELARHRATMEALLDPVLTIDARGKVVSASRAVSPLLGWEPRELVGRDLGVIMPEPHRSAHVEYVAKHLRSGRTGVLGRPRQVEALRRDGTRVPVEISISRVRVPGEVEPFFVGIVHDLSEQRRLETSLRRSERRMHFAMRVAGAGVWDWNTQTGEAWWSAEMYELFGVPSGTRMCRECSLACVLEEDRDRVARVLDLAVLRRRNYRCEYRVRHPELGLRWMESHGRLDDESGTVPTHLLGFTIDITRRKQSEEELARHRDKLEHLVSERTEELRRSQEQMRVSDRMASIGTLAAGLGHDMNNVLLPVRANLNAARAAHGERAPDIVRRCVDQIQKGVDYLQHLADGLHFLTMDPEFPDGGRTDLASWWEQTGSLLCKAVPKHVRVDTNLAEEGARRLPAMAIAPHRLTQAMLNLIVNAGQAIPSLIERPRRGGLIRIEAEVEGNVSKGCPVVLLLRVRDNGGGMSEEVKKRAFEMFFTTKPRGLGTGLGLPLVARVVKNAGGTVEIDSKEGCGTTVTLRIPAIAPSPVPPSTPMCAVISLRDRRVAGVVRQLFEAAGAETRDAVDPGDGCWWVIEPESTRLAAARRWVGASKERSRLRRLLVVGPCSAASRASWRKQNAILIERPDDFASLREAVGRAVAGT